MISPFKSTYRTTSEYGMRTLKGVKEMHYGIDLVGTDGTLLATVDGTVTGVRTTIPDSHTGLYVTQNVVGNYVYITTTGGYQVMYRHLRYNSCPAAIKVGAAVKAGDVIGRMGSTGQSSGPHLHYEMRDPAGIAFDPKPYLNTAKTIEAATVTATAAKKSVDEVAREVIAGKWGVNPERKQRLTAAGYDYTAVQTRVNALLK